MTPPDIFGSSSAIEYDVTKIIIPPCSDRAGAVDAAAAHRFTMSKDVTHGESGIYTAEGNLAGSRAARLAKKREEQKAEFEKQKAEIEAASARRLNNMGAKFAPRSVVSIETEFKVCACMGVPSCRRAPHALACLGQVRICPRV